MLQFLPALLSGGASAILPTLGNILMSTAMSEVGTKLFGRDVGGLFGMMMGKDFFDVTGGADKIKNLPGISGKADDIAKNFLNPTTDTFSKGASNIGEKLMSQAPKAAFSLPEVAKNATSIAAKTPLKTMQIANSFSGPKSGPKAGFSGFGDKLKDFAGKDGSKLATAMFEQDQRFKDEDAAFKRNNPAQMWIPNNRQWGV